jgi:transcriptional regulator with XRE-family HTH domain
MKTTQTVGEGTGRKLRALRLRAHLSMRELARRATVAVSCVSNLEAGRLSVSLATLRKLLVALDTDLGPFFADELPAPPGWVFRRHQMCATTDAGRCYTFVLPPRPDIGMILLDEELFAGEQPDFEPLRGDLAGYVLAGDLKVEMRGEEPQVLQAGDAFYIPAGRAVRGWCARGESVRLVTVMISTRTGEAGHDTRRHGTRARLPKQTGSVSSGGRETRGGPGRTGGKPHENRTVFPVDLAKPGGRRGG